MSDKPSEQALAIAQAIETILKPAPDPAAPAPDSAAPAATETPGQAYVRQQEQAGAAAAPAAPPTGKQPLRTLDDLDGLSQEEFDRRFDEVQAVLRAQPGA